MSFSPSSPPTRPSCNQSPPAATLSMAPPAKTAQHASLVLKRGTTYTAVGVPVPAVRNGGHAMYLSWVLQRKLEQVGSFFGKVRTHTSAHVVVGCAACLQYM